MNFLEDKIYGLWSLQLDTVIDRIDAKSNQCMVLANFGNHALHQMFPTLDLGLLPQLNDVFLETCKEFEVEMKEYPWHNFPLQETQTLEYS